MPHVSRTRVDGSVDVTFRTVEPDPSCEVLLDVDFLLHAAWPDVDHLVLQHRRGVGERTVTVRLPADVELSYRFVRRLASERPGRTLDDLRALTATGSGDPEVDAHIDDAFGSGVRASILRLPDAAPPHPAYDVAAPVLRTLERTATTVGGHRLTVLHGASTRAVAVLLDGDVWLESLGLAHAAARIDTDGLTLAALSTPDRGMLAERETMAELVVDAVLPAVETIAGVRLRPREVAVVGQSYGGLAAAGILVDRPDRVGAAIVSSGSFWFDAATDARDSGVPGTLVRELADADLRHARLLLHVGREEREMVSLSRAFADAASRAGATVDLEVHPGGHDYAWYRHRVLAALETWRSTCPR